MITPADLLGAQKMAVGQKIEENYIKELLDILYNIGASGALSMDALAAKLDRLTSKVTESGQLDQFKQIIHFYSSTDVTVPQLGSAPYSAIDSDGLTPVEQVKFSQIVGSNNDPNKVTPVRKTMGIVLSNSPYISPSVRNAERVERFMNFMPSIIASRMVPFLEVEFAFNRGIPTAAAGTTVPKMWEPSLLKFLLGGDQSINADLSTGTGKMLSLQETQDTSPTSGVTSLHSVAGMEMFTSPQTLVNPSPSVDGSRYVDVLDPFRPFMSIESFTVSVTPTVGLYSYKKGSLVLKLHDRSRLAEISDLLRPQIYQDRLSAPTVWLTYGWRHPAEPGNPYADFINGNMLVREAYGIINSQFAFDQLGQVTVTVELWTKGLAELRTLRTNDDADRPLKAFDELRQLADIIKKNALAQSIGQADGIHKEIRSQLLIEAAERGSFPDLSTPEIKSALDSLKKGLLSKNAVVDKAAAQQLIAALDKFYKSDDKGNLDYKTQIEKQATMKTAEQFNEVMTGPDPFLPSTAKDAKHASENRGSPHPLTTLVETLNAYKGEAEIKTLATPVKGATLGFRKKVASFGKLVSVFLANSLKSLDQVEELQLYFYQLNDQAGAAANTNLASFPIEMPVFLDQYRELIERRGTERLTVEEFLRLCVDAQLSDTRAIGYGFRTFFAPYDPSNKFDAKLQKGTEQAYENALSGISSKHGPFKKPTIETYVETVYESAIDPTDIDLLHQFENTAPQAGGSNLGRAGHFKRIMRIHFFDRSNSPYKLPGVILRGDGNADPAFLEVPSKTSANAAVYGDILNSLVGQSGGKVTSDAKIDGNASPSGKVITNQDIKNFVSRMVPTIIYGGNASSVISANLASKQDPLLSTTQMLAMKSGKPSVLQPNGSGVGGLPLRIIPASMTMTTMGCPLLTFGQLYFIDFNTGTTIDNIYGLTGVVHTIAPGKFESNMTLTFYDAYGKFEGAPSIIEYTKQVLEKATA